MEDVGLQQRELIWPYKETTCCQVEVGDQFVNYFEVISVSYRIMFWDTDKHNEFHHGEAWNMDAPVLQTELKTEDESAWSWGEEPAKEPAQTVQGFWGKDFWDDDYKDEQFVKIDDKGVKKEEGAWDQVNFIQKSKDEEELELQISRGEHFEDPSFPKNKDSIGAVGFKGVIKWQKLSTLFKGMKIFDNIEPSDIYQQQLGDCYFLAGISTLAEYPQRIKKLFITKEVNEHKYFQVQILCKGVWRNITIDEYVPIKEGGKYPLFCSTKSNQIWAVLLEKAWAKLFKTFRDIEAGYLYQPLRALTGAPVIQITHNTMSPEEFFKRVTQYDKSDYSMMCSSNSGSDTTTNKINIALGHAYSLLGVYVVTVGDKAYRLLKLRNPWGQGESKGRFSDEDSIWKDVSPGVKEDIGYINKNDGTFFITLEDFWTSFRTTTVAMVNDSWSYVSCRQEHNFKNGMYFKVRIDNPGSYSFQFDQTSFRSFGEAKFTYKFNDLTLLIGKVTPSGIKYMEGCFIKYQWAEKTHKLDVGDYIVYLKDNNANKMETPGKYALSVYGEFPCKIQPSCKEACKDFIRQYCVDAALTQGSKKPLGPGREFIQMVMKEGYTVFLITNKSATPIKLEIGYDPVPYSHFKFEFKDKTNFQITAVSGNHGVAIGRNRDSNYRGMTVKSIKLLG